MDYTLVYSFELYQNRKIAIMQCFEIQKGEKFQKEDYFEMKTFQMYLDHSGNHNCFGLFP